MKYKLNEELDTVVEILGNTTSILDEIVQFDINQLKINEDLKEKHKKSWYEVDKAWLHISIIETLLAFNIFATLALLGSK